VIGRHLYSRQMDTAVLLSELKNVVKHDFELLEGPVFWARLARGFINVRGLCFVCFQTTSTNLLLISSAVFDYYATNCYLLLFYLRLLTGF